MKITRGWGALVILALAWSLQACATVYSAKSIEIWIVDEDTSQPLEGVIAVASWELTQGSFAGGGGAIAPFKVLESVSDGQGRLYFDAWGPKPEIGFGTYFWSTDPSIVFFKQGYDPRRLSNSLTGGPNYNPVRISDWDGMTVKLRKFKGTTKEYATKIDNYFGTGLPYITHENCGWRDIPRMVLAVDQMRKEFASQGIFVPLPTIDSLESSSAQECGSVREFFRSHGFVEVIEVQTPTKSEKLGVGPGNRQQSTGHDPQPR